MCGGHFLHLRGEGVAILIDVLDGHVPGWRGDGFRVGGNVLDFLGALAVELLRRGGDGNVVAFDFDLGHAATSTGSFARVKPRAFAHQCRSSSERMSTSRKPPDKDPPL
jgi:hypothetical protein